MVNVRTKSKQGQSGRGLCVVPADMGELVGSGHSLKVESVRFADGLDMRSERKEGVKNDAEVFGLSNSRESLLFYLA